ncbi:MAG: hypothetical protein BWY79_01753 [Actinobacteria bacterium ADurb.Bin444]|nr:MAG: hypothetical protein BWY79_01753 [Actinobacteria bacterium ADurb.Bin444]
MFTDAASSSLLFREVQRFRQWYVVLILAVVAVLQWWGFVTQIVLGRPFGSNPGPDWLVLVFWVVFGIVFPLGFAALRLETRVEPGLLRVRLVPLNHLRIPIHTIRHAEVVTYHPFRDFGGWGLRWSGKGRALNAYGSRGVQLILDDGSRILVGSQRPDELLIALHAAGYA